VRLALAGGLFAAAIVVAFAAISLLPASSSPTGVNKAWARDAVARAAAVSAGRGNGVLHIDMLVSDTSAALATPARYRLDSWTRLSGPFAYWQVIRSGSDVTTTTVLGDRVESYDSSSNTLSGGTKQIAGAQPRAVLFDPAYHAVLSLLYPGETNAKTLPRTLSALIARLIRSPHVRVTRTAHFDGKPAVRITALGGRAVLFLQPRTYRPLEFVIAGDPGAGPQREAVMTMRFDAYETLPRGAVSPPNLAQLHPSALPAS
jgi:hypothetical protein